MAGNRVICHCKNVDYLAIRKAMVAGARTLDEIKDIPRVNIDDIVRESGDWRNPSDVIKAGKVAVGLLEEYLKKQWSFNQVG